MKMSFNSKVFDSDFIKIIPFFKIYGDYMLNYGDSLTLLTTLSTTHKGIREYFEQFERTNESIQSLLITPVQRLPRYKLLFTELLHKTSLQH